MLVQYLDCDGLDKLFSFSGHDYQIKEIDGKFYMLDGGCTTQPDGYARYSGGTIKEGEVKELIGDIREAYTWTQRVDKNDKLLKKPVTSLLKDLTSGHICGILRYFNNRAYRILERFEKTDNYPATDKGWHIIQSILIEELNYRIENNIVQ